MGFVEVSEVGEGASEVVVVVVEVEVEMSSREDTNL